jgi:hypothetical protein
MRFGLWAVAVTATALVAGCAAQPEPPEMVEVEGVVLLDGVPLNKAEVRFIPTAEYGIDYIARGVTDEKGRFKLTCGTQTGAVVGENYVTVMESEIPEHLTPESRRDDLNKYMRSLGNRPIPARYGNVAESPIKAMVAADKKEKDYTFRLTRPR